MEWEHMNVLRNINPVLPQPVFDKYISILNNEYSHYKSLDIFDRANIYRLKYQALHFCLRRNYIETTEFEDYVREFTYLV